MRFPLRCRRDLYVTSGTVFAYRKLPFKKLIAAMWLSVNAVKGLAALHLSRLIDTQFKTA
ncbi:hypothetical protein ASG43_17400 [Aureimonas sp. Leaf454]|nr:hypothetical protein ASG43_17400 [Aureimonas sp. Leaf454]